MPLPLTQIQLDLIQKRHDAAGRIVWSDGYGEDYVNAADFDQYRADHQALLDENERLARQLSEAWQVLAAVAAAGEIEVNAEVLHMVESLLRRHKAPGWKE